MPLTFSNDDIKCTTGPIARWIAKCVGHFGCSYCKKLTNLMTLANQRGCS